MYCIIEVLSVCVIMKGEDIRVNQPEFNNYTQVVTDILL